MDTLAHGLWGSAAFGQCNNRWKWAFWLGMAPDLLSFGPFFLGRIGDLGERVLGHRTGPPDPSSIPAYVYHAYDVTHSLLVWGAIVLITWIIFKRKGKPAQALLPLGAWALHIFCDIPTHSKMFFPTPFLWPFKTPFYDGTSWGNKTFMIWNYSLIGIAYLVVAIRTFRARTK